MDLPVRGPAFFGGKTADFPGARSAPGPVTQVDPKSTGFLEGKLVGLKTNPYCRMHGMNGIFTYING